VVNPNGIYPSKQTADNWINASAFAPLCTPALRQGGTPCQEPGTYGNLGYNSLKGPHTVQINMALSRTFAIRERQSVQIRAEAFNLPNHLNLATPGPRMAGVGNIGRSVNLNTTNFGQITQDISGNNGLLDGDYRVIQFALKWMF